MILLTGYTHNVNYKALFDINHVIRGMVNKSYMI